MEIFPNWVGVNRKMCEHCQTCPHECQPPKINRTKQFIIQVVYLTVVLIPNMLLKKLVKARIKKALTKQWNSMTPEMQRFYYQLQQMMSTQMPIEELPKEWRGGLTDFG